MKRFIDLFVSFSIIVLLCPFFFAISLIIYFTGDGEIIFKQERVGLNKKFFKIFKFATMQKNSAKIGPGTLTLENDPRVLPFGKFLRKTKINEIPQLFNILLGDMSFVGPRPLIPSGEDFYSEDDSKIIRSIKPGVTGIGSVILRDEESYYAHRNDAHVFYKNVISPYKAVLEKWYVENHSFNVDLKIVILTGFSILFPEIKVSRFFNDLPKMPKDLLESKKN